MLCIVWWNISQCQLADMDEVVLNLMISQQFLCVKTFVNTTLMTTFVQSLYLVNKIWRFKLVSWHWVMQSLGNEVRLFYKVKNMVLFTCMWADPWIKCESVQRKEEPCLRNSFILLILPAHLNRVQNILIDWAVLKCSVIRKCIYKFIAMLPNFLC